MNEKIQEYTERCYMHLAAAQRLEAEYQAQLRAFRDDVRDFAAFLDGLRDDEQEDLAEVTYHFVDDEDASDVVRQDYVVAPTHDKDFSGDGKPRNCHVMVNLMDSYREGLITLDDVWALSGVVL